MPSLSIKNFSCIDSAHVEIKPITILIGPQASGKSIISKLLYFFNAIFVDQYQAADEGNNIKNFQRILEKKFSSWFPSSAWGNKDFYIEYNAGPISITILKRKSRNRPDTRSASIHFSEPFNKFYNELASSYSKMSRQVSDDEYNPHTFDRNWQIFREYSKILRSILRDNYVNSQIFVPAGRSFYTNLGKAVAILEHGSKLDDITKQFGRIFTSLLDGQFRTYLGEETSQHIKDFLPRQRKAANEMFGGEIKLSSNDTYVAAADGRKIPFSILSSGQQELLPLILILQYYTATLAHNTHPGISVLYVEEPEAHLFPETQGYLTEHLAEISNISRGDGRLIITTHSPYVLSKFNNLIKAYMVSEIDEYRADRVSTIISRSAWLPPTSVSAYAIQDGRVNNIIDESGLINASYLDNISNEISEDFMSLLDVEMRYD